MFFFLVVRARNEAFNVCLYNYNLPDRGICNPVVKSSIHAHVGALICLVDCSGAIHKKVCKLSCCGSEPVANNWYWFEPAQTVEMREAPDQVKSQLEGQAYFSYFFNHITLIHSQGPQHHQQGLSTTEIDIINSYSPLLVTMGVCLSIKV